MFHLTEIDECTLPDDPCADNAVCSNLKGGYACDCATGYTGDGKLDCTGTFKSIICFGRL